MLLLLKYVKKLVNLNLLHLLNNRIVSKSVEREEEDGTHTCVKMIHSNILSPFIADVSVATSKHNFAVGSFDMKNEKIRNSANENKC